MNSLELRKKVSDLKRKKKINEERVSAEELRGRYRIPYEALCQELKECQAALRTKYMDFVRAASEILSDAVYADPDVEYEEMHCRFCKLDEEFGQDPLFRRLMSAIFTFEDAKDD